ATHRAAAWQSCTAAGNLCSGASRYPTETVAQPAALVRLRQMPSEVSMLPSVQPPPKKYSSAGNGPSPAGRQLRIPRSPPGPGEFPLGHVGDRLGIGRRLPDRLQVLGPRLRQRHRVQRRDTGRLPTCAKLLDLRVEWHVGSPGYRRLGTRPTAAAIGPRTA